MGFEMLAFLGLVLAKSNGLAVTPLCWGILVVWSAIHLGLIWFGYGGDGDV